MSAMVEQKYIQFISSALERFKWVSHLKTANFRCPICGDSATNKQKCRGYIYIIQKTDMYCYRCHNCGASMSFRNFLKLKFPHYYQEYRLENYVSQGRPNKVTEVTYSKPIETIASKVEVKPAAPERLLIPLSSLPEDHLVVEYCNSRQIPKSKFRDLYYTESFGKWVKPYIDEPDKKFPMDARLVMLMRDYEGTVFGAQGRALDPDATLRYITVKFDEDKQKVFGANKIDVDMPVFVLEGIIDSLFVPNSVAICGGDVGSSLNQLGIPMDKFFVVLDNERRSKDTIRRMEHAINLGCRVCIWPLSSNLKDVNEMIKSGITPNEVLKIIVNNSYKGTKAMLKLKQWARV